FSFSAPSHYLSLLSFPTRRSSDLSLQLKAKGGNTNAAYNDKYLVGDGSTPSDAVAAASAYIPSTQFYVKEHEDGTYSIQGREARSEEHTSELQSRFDLVCRLLLEK